MIRSRTFAALVECPDYRKYFIGHGISLCGSWLQQAAVLWLVLERTGSESWLGVIDATGLLPGVVVGLLAGAMADRVEPRRMVVTMQFAQLLLAALLAWLVGTGQARLWHMGAILAANRVCVTFEMPSRQVFLYEVVGRNRLMNAIALNSGLFNASRVIGPALAGILLARYGATMCFGLNALSFLAAMAAILAIRPRRTPGEKADLPTDAEGAGASLLGGWRYLNTHRRVRLLFVLVFAFGVIAMGYTALVPAYARKVIGSGPIGYSFLLSSVGLGATMGALVVASMGGLRRKEVLVLAGCVVFGIALAGAGTLPGMFEGPEHRRARLMVGCAMLWLAGAGGILFYSSAQTLIQLAVPDVLRGRIIGLWMIGFSGSVPLGSLWSGWAASNLGVAKVMVVSAALCIILAGVGLAAGLLAQSLEPAE